MPNHYEISPPDFRRAPHGGRAWEYAQNSLSSLASIVPADVNDAPYPPAPEVLSVLQNALQYIQWAPDTWGDHLREYIATDVGTGATQIMVDAGSSPLLQHAYETLVPEGSSVVMLRPSYSEYAAGAQRRRAVALEVDLLPEEHFAIIPQRILERIDNATNLLIIGNPNNPTGTGLVQEQIREILINLPEHVTTVIDEVYIDYAPERSAIRFINEFPRLCVLRSFSKGYALAGLRIGYAALSQDLVPCWLQNGEVPWRVSLLADIAARAALRNRTYIEKQIRLLVDEREWLRHQVGDLLNCETFNSLTHFFLFRWPETTMAEDIVRQLSETNILIRPISWSSQPQGPPFFRLTTRSRTENERLLHALAMWRRRL